MTLACSWCSQPGELDVTNRDAGGRTHLWHHACWRAQCAWLRGHNGLPVVPGPEWSLATPRRYKGYAK